MTRYYVAVLERDRARRFVARIPDLHGLQMTAGANRAEALVKLVIAANEHVRLEAAQGEEIPAPRDLDDIPADEEVEEVGRALVPVELPGRSLKISMTIDEALLRHVDRAAAAEGTTRSGYLAMAAVKALRANR